MRHQAEIRPLLPPLEWRFQGKDTNIIGLSASPPRLSTKYPILYWWPVTCPARAFYGSIGCFSADSLVWNALWRAAHHSSHLSWPSLLQAVSLWIYSTLASFTPPLSLVAALSRLQLYSTSLQLTLYLPSTLVVFSTSEQLVANLEKRGGRRGSISPAIAATRVPSHPLYMITTAGPGIYQLS